MRPNPAGNDSSPAIEAGDLSKSYGEVHALRSLDVAVQRGTIFGLLGPNGAGKTTAVRILTTLLQPDGGWARVGGFDVVHQADRVRENVGLAGQYAAVDENLSGQENLYMVGRLYHLGSPAARARATELLEDFDLSEASGRLVRTYSGGMRRRLSLAAAMVARPSILFLDEPTSGLDPRSRLGLWEGIEALVAEGTTVFLTTQYLDEVDRLAHLIAVMDQGLLIAQGTSDELKAQVGGDRLEVRLDDRAHQEAAMSLLSYLADAPPSVEDEFLRVPLRARQGAIADAVRRLDEAGIGIEDIAMRRPTLDDVFLTLTGHAAESEEDGVSAGRTEKADKGAKAKRRWRR